MRARAVVRSLVAVVALAPTTLYSGPALSAVPAVGGATSPSTHQAAWGDVRLSGTLVALHPARRTGDLALSNGNLVPLRFTSVEQERRLHVGDRLLVSALAHGHARLLVRSVRVQSLGARWWGNHWSGSRWLIHGTVGRMLGRGNAEVLGINGAAVVLHVGNAHVTEAQPTAALLAPATALADSGPQVYVGEVIETQVAVTRRETVDALVVRVVAAHAARIDVEGTVTAVNEKIGTVTLTNEDGQVTVVAMGTQAAAYRVGQDAEVSGKPMDAAGDAAAIRAQSAEHERGSTAGDTGRGPGDQPTPQAIATATPGEGGAGSGGAPAGTGSGHSAGATTEATATGTSAAGSGTDNGPGPYATPSGTPDAQGHFALPPGTPDTKGHLTKPATPQATPGHASPVEPAPPTAPTDVAPPVTPGVTPAVMPPALPTQTAVGQPTVAAATPPVAGPPATAVVVVATPQANGEATAVSTEPAGLSGRSAPVPHGNTQADVNEPTPSATALPT